MCTTPKSKVKWKLRKVNVKVKCTIDWYGRLISGKKEKASSFELFQRRVWSSPCSRSRGGGVLRVPVRRSRGRHHRLRQRLAHHCHGQTSGVLQYGLFLSKLMVFLCQVAVSLFQAGANIVTLGILKASDRPHDIIAFAQGQTPFGWDHYSYCLHICHIYDGAQCNQTISEK